MLVDTDVFSLIFAGRPAGRRYVPHIEGRTGAVSFQTVAELLQGAYMRGWGSRRLDHLRAEIARYLVAPWNEDVVEHFARVRAHRRSIGREIHVADAWVAATALQLECPVVTHNLRDFADVPGLTVITEPGA